jgi:hypothetical protein
MDSTALIVWQSFLQTSPTDRRDSLLRCISKELAEELLSLPPFSFERQADVEAPEEELSKIHYSWLAPFLRSLPENEIKLFLSAMSDEQIEGLKESLLLSNALPTPSQLGKTYLRKTLFEMIATDDLIPVCLLPEESLNDLLSLSFEEINSLIDLLSMHDLSIEIRHIIETSKLKEIYALLTKAQTTFLKTLIHKKEPVSFKKMGLLGWKGDTQALSSMLLQRGINRIAKSLYGKSPSLLWHVAHRIESDKGQLLMKLCTALDHPRASALLSEQVVELIGVLKNTHPRQNRQNP